MAVTIASLLADFSPKSGSEALGIGLLRAAKVAPEPMPEPVQPVVDRQAESAEGRRSEGARRGEGKRSSRP